MSLEKLSCKTISELGGGSAGPLIDRAIAEAVRDFDDRAEEDGKPRQVAITITLEMGETGPLVRCQAQAKIPPRSAMATCGSIRSREGQQSLNFQTGSPDNVDQPTFPPMDPQ